MRVHADYAEPADLPSWYAEQFSIPETGAVVSSIVSGETSDPGSMVVSSTNDGVTTVTGPAYTIACLINV